MLGVLSLYYTNLLSCPLRIPRSLLPVPRCPSPAASPVFTVAPF
jgi:hypothetical protein